MSSFLKKLITVLLSLLLFAYIGYRAYLAFYHPLRTVKAQSSVVQDMVTVSAVMLHNDSVIQGSTDGGVIDYIRSDGERVPKGGVVANVYASSQDAQKAVRLQNLNAKIAKLQQEQSSKDVSAGDITMLDSEIDSGVITLSDAASSSGLETLSDAADKLLDLFNRKQIATGTVKDYTAEIASLNSQAAALGAVNPVRSIASPLSGCFVSSADGFEGIYDTSKIDTINAADVSKLLSLKPTVKSGSVGKIVSDYKWYIVCNVSNNDSFKFTKGAQMSVQFPMSSQNAVPVTVKAVNKSSSGCAIALECGYMTGKLAVMRRQQVEIVSSEVNGIKIENDSINIVNGVKGVFILKGNTVAFRRIEPVYSGNGFTVSAVDTTDSKRLQVYDSVIIGGDDLYDGKIVN
jgi:hypothetical protein